MVSATAKHVYDCIVRRFLSIFYPPAVYQKVALTTQIRRESFFSGFKVLAEEGYLKVVGLPSNKKATQNAGNGESTEPVSYTHLDVYKRQFVSSLVRFHLTDQDLEQHSFGKFVSADKSNFIIMVQCKSDVVEDLFAVDRLGKPLYGKDFVSDLTRCV